MYNRSLALLAVALTLSLAACEAPDAAPGTVSNTPLESQLEESARLNQDSARNNLQLARNLYLELSAPLQNVSTEVDAYRRLVNEMLPPMLSVANSLSGSTATDQDTSQLKADFQELYSDTMAQVVQGINTNLAIYQNQIEGPQSVDTAGGSSLKTLRELTALFQATEYAERFSAQLSQFSGLLSNGTAVLNGIRNQQSVVINGVLRISQRVNSLQELQASYQTLVQTLTRPELLSQLAQLAQRAYGEDNVALRQGELTPSQPDASQLQMVVREDLNHYRLIRITSGRLSNELLVDTRGLSASDWLHNSNVVVIPKSQP
ncbi:MAG: hypothetical protein ACAI44_00095 [Candidatus Sericytochromatia bacterium]